MDLRFSSLQRQIQRVFPEARLDSYRIDFSRFQLRFELGDDKSYGSLERVGQSVDRAVKLFEACNDSSDEVVLIHNEYLSGEIFPSRPEGYILTLIQSDGACRAERTVPASEDDGEFTQFAYQSNLARLAYSAIFRGIANVEQGRSPSIGGRVYLVNTTRNITFYMYDDRGCLIFADRPEKLKRLYIERNSWLVNDYRSYFDEVFGGSE
jgi:hypothetical protein